MILKIPMNMKKQQMGTDTLLSKYCELVKLLVFYQNITHIRLF